MRPITFLVLLLWSATTFAQTIVPLTNNLVVNSGDHLQFETGNYAFSDIEEDGVLQLNGVQNVILDGAGVTINGSTFNGYFIFMENCDNVTIRNFELAEGYFYAIYAVNSTNITIEDNTFSNNQRDDEGWIVIFDGPEFAHGGGVFMDQCSAVMIQSNDMNEQNDGVALYNCEDITVIDNDLSWNTSFGIRMYHTHNSFIDNNNCSHTNRALTDPSDCAAILLLDAFDNEVTNNNFTFSGDGIFLNNYNTMEPANNYFAYNECSNSPHNAVEAVFSIGNVFKHNTCSFSNYGFWLGYSSQTVVDSNEIHGNAGLDGDGGAGIAIDRGYENTITNNLISQNHRGIKLWEGGLIAPYSNESETYTITGNTFFGNQRAIHATDTEVVTCKENTFEMNFHDIFIDGTADDFLVQDNTFGMNSGYYIELASPDDLEATNNYFPEMPEVPGFLDCKIYDSNDDPARGTVSVEPYYSAPSLNLLDGPPADLAEQPAVWDGYLYAEDGAYTVVSWDENEKMAGEASVFLQTESGWDVHLHYYPGPYDHAIWGLEPTGSIRFWMKINITDPDNPYGVQESFVRIGDACGNYYQFTNDYFQAIDPHILNNAIDQWAAFEIPLSGNDTWVRTEQGTVDLYAINYITFNVDVWEYGYELWLDSLTLPDVINSTTTSPTARLEWTASPNPTINNWILTARSETAVTIDRIELYNTSGTLIYQLPKQELPAGEQIIHLPAQDLLPGQYFALIVSRNGAQSIPLLKME
jgi:parallel beta-helix repeat protein